MKRTLFFFAIITSALISSAQTVSIGAIGGVALLDQTLNQNESRRYIVGPSVEVRFFDHFAVEADALYQRLGNTLYFATVAGVPVSFVSRQRGNSWEFPLQGKYYFRPRTAAWRPFLGTGYAFRTIGVHESITGPAVIGSGTPPAAHVNFRSNLGVGAMFSAGLRMGAGRLAILPELRYTRWGSQDNLTRKDEAAFLLGVSF